ncbi:hypothetical protein SO802_030199 [Lithocarpus litseifolius]|uniref:Uncharacterized protein n=1 Tax=Lithocarpus litseifolius TaxID=425828 RepID=A0AAW2BIK8_9ROSI
MGFSYLLRTNADAESFKTRFNIRRDVNISYYEEGDIEDQRFQKIPIRPEHCTSFGIKLRVALENFHALQWEVESFPLNSWGMVQRHNMALERWFPAAQPVGGQIVPQTTPRRANPPPAQQQRRKKKRVVDDPHPEFGSFLTDQPPKSTNVTTPIL